MRTFVSLIVLALCASGCAGRHFALASPEHFLELEEGHQRALGYELRSVSADGIVLGVRQLDNDRHGSGEFWVEAIRNRLRRDAAYALISESEVHARTGEAGYQMRLGRDDEGHPYRYWITVYVTHDRIYIVEAGGREERFEEVETELETALASFSIE